MATITKVPATDATTGRPTFRYRVRVVVGHRANGTAIQEMRTFATRRIAEQEGAKWEADIARNVAGAASRTRLGDYLGDWLQRKARTARPITVEGYRYLIAHCITPTPLAQQPLREITPALVQHWLDGIPLPATAGKARAVLNIALHEAHRLGLLSSNPVAVTQAPAHTPKVGIALTAEDAQRFLAAARADLYTPFWHLAVYLGMRPSEIAGLRWGAVDLEAGTLRVERARSTACGKTFEAEATKSAAGKRTYTLPGPVLALLREHKATQRERRKALLHRWREHDLVCTTEIGTPLDHRSVQRRFHALCARSGLPHIRVYDLRHTATSLMIDAGADLKAASEALGHSDPRITMQVYRHVRGDQRARAVGLLAEALQPANREATTS